MGTDEHYLQKICAFLSGIKVWREKNTSDKINRETELMAN